MTNKCLKAITFCFYRDFRKASMSQKMQTVLFLGRQMGVKVQGTVRGGPNGKHGNWGWELNRLLVLRKQQLRNAVFCKESFVFTFLTYKMSSVFGTGQSTNSMAWKLAKWAKFVLVLMNTQLLKKSRIFVNRISKVKHTTANWTVRILHEATSVVTCNIKAWLLCEIFWFFYLFSLCSILLE